MTSTQQTGTFPEIPGFELQERIGVGSFGVVYKALLKSLDRVVAIKVMREELAVDSAFRERFDREWKTAAELKHPNIVQIFEAGEHNGLHYFVMEHVGGDSLEGRLRRGETLDESGALAVTEAVANALKYALESNGTIHGDLRPGNIMFESDGTIKIVDFFGVPTEEHPYMSPEAETMGREDLDFKSDIYSLGAVLYHLLTGQTPHVPKSASGLSGKSASVLKPPDSINKSLSENLSLLIEKLLVRVRQVRYGSWDDLMADLQSVTDGHPPSRLPPMGASAIRRGNQPTTAEKSRPPSPPPPVENTKESPDAPTEIRLTVEEETEAAPPEPSVDSMDAAPAAQEMPSISKSGRPRLKIQARKPAEPEPEPEPSTQPQKFVTVRNKRKSDAGNSLRVLVGIGMAAIFVVACCWYFWVHVGAGFFAGGDDEVLPDPSFDVPRPDAGLTDDAQPAEESVPVEPVEITAEIDVDPPDEPKGTGFPNEFSEYLDAISPALDQTARRQYRHGEGTLILWLGKNRNHPYGPHAERQVARIRRVASLVKLLEENEAHIVDARIDPGKVVGIENDKIEVQTVGGGRPSTRAISIDVLSDRDYLSLLKLADPEGIPVHGAMYMISRGEFDKALQFMNDGNIKESDFTELKAWFDEWRSILGDLLAQEAVDEVRRLARRGDFRQAKHKLDLVFDKFPETDTFQWARKKEIEELQLEITEVVSRMDSRRQAIAEAGDEQRIPSTTAAELGRSPNIEVTVQRDKNNRSTPGLASQNVTVRVRLRNREQKTDFENLTQHIYAVAQHRLYDNHYRLLIKEVDPVSLPVGGAYEYLTKSVPIAASGEEQADNSFAYFGWLLLLKDYEGTVLLTKGSQSKLLKNAAALSEVAEGSEFSL